MDEPLCIFNAEPRREVRLACLQEWETLFWLHSAVVRCHDSYWLEVHPTTGSPQQPMEAPAVCSNVNDGVFMQAGDGGTYLSRVQAAWCV